MSVKRLIAGLVCVVAAAAAVPQPAGAKGRVELRSPPPAGLRAGDTWNAELVVRAGGNELAAADPPTILIHNRAAGWTEIPASERGGWLASPLAVGSLLAVAAAVAAAMVARLRRRAAVRLL